LAHYATDALFSCCFPSWTSRVRVPAKITFDFKCDGPGFGKGGRGVLKVDDKEVASKTIAHTIPFLMALDETGVDTRTPVDDRDYHIPFRFTGRITNLTITLKPERMAAGEVAPQAKSPHDWEK